MADAKSSTIAAHGYDPETKTAHIRFHSGATYAYSNVDPAHFNALIGAASIGKHFHSTFKPAYKGVKLA